MRNMIAGNGGEGIRVAGTAAERVAMRYNHVERNGQRVHEAGINVSGDVSGLQIEHNTFVDRQHRPTRGPAVVVAPGVRVRGGIIDSNDTAGNPGGGVRIEGHLEHAGARSSPPADGR